MIGTNYEFKTKTELFTLLITLIGLNISVIYVKYSYSNFVLFIIGFILLCVPMIILLLSKKNKLLNIPFILFLILLTVLFSQYLLVIGSNYIQGTDGPFNFYIIKNLLDDSFKFKLDDANSSFNMRFYGLQLFCNVTSILLHCSLKAVCLYITPLFGVVSIFTYFSLVKNLFPIKLVLISTILLSWSLTYVGYGIELRPENLGFLFFISIFFMIVKRNISKKPDCSYSILAIFISFILVITHSAATIHAIIISTAFCINALYYSKKRTEMSHIGHMPLIITLFFIFYMMYTTNSFTMFFNMIDKSIVNAFSINQNMIFEEKGFSASGSEIPIIITIVVWIERMLFVIGIFVLVYNIYIKKTPDNKNPLYQFILLWSIIYISIIILLIPAKTLNPARFYRFFEIPFSIIKSISLLCLLTLNPSISEKFLKTPLFITNTISDKYRKLFSLHNMQLLIVIIIIMLIMMNSICLLPKWIIDIELNSYHEKPYADFSDRDIIAGEFALNHIRDTNFIGDFRTNVIFGTIGHKKVIIPKYKNVSIEYLDTFDKPVFIDLRANNIKSIDFNENIANQTHQIYDNQLLNLNLYT